MRYLIFGLLLLFVACKKDNETQIVDDTPVVDMRTDCLGEYSFTFIKCLIDDTVKVDGRIVLYEDVNKDEINSEDTNHGNETDQSHTKIAMIIGEGEDQFIIASEMESSTAFKTKDFNDPCCYAQEGSFVSDHTSFYFKRSWHQMVNYTGACYEVYGERK